MITEYDEIRDEHYMNCWTGNQLSDEINRVLNRNQTIETHEEEEYRNALHEQRSVNKRL